MPVASDIGPTSGPAQVDFVAPNVGYSSGDAGARLLAANGDVCSLRPYIDDDGYSYIDQFVGFDKAKKKNVYRQQPMVGNTATLRKDEWIELDKEITRAARAELNFLPILEAAGLSRGVAGGMAVTVLQYQAMTDAGQAQIDMDGLADTNRDRSVYDLRGLPLPIAHSGFSFGLREVLTSRRFGFGIDTNMAEQSTRKVMELLENLFLGTLATYTYGGYTVYGFRNFPYRFTQTFTLPSGAGWTPDLMVSELLVSLQTLVNNYFRGPYALFHSPGWIQWLDNDYSAAYKSGTLRNRIMEIKDITSITKVDYLPNYELVLVQLNRNTVQVVNFMETTPFQWETKGGWQINNKIARGTVPLLRANTGLTSGIVHGTAV